MKGLTRYINHGLSFGPPQTRTQTLTQTHTHTHTLTHTHTHRNNTSVFVHAPHDCKFKIASWEGLAEADYLASEINNPAKYKAGNKIWSLKCMLLLGGVWL